MLLIYYPSNMSGHKQPSSGIFATLSADFKINTCYSLKDDTVSKEDKHTLT